METLANIDTILVRKYNCTCLPDNEYQCVQERKRNGSAMHGVECESIELPGEPTKYKLCVYQSSRSRHSRPKVECYIIPNPVALVKRCYNEMCKISNGAHLWKWAGSIGAASLVIFVGIERTTISMLCWINLCALVPTPIILYSWIAEKNYVAETWAWIMVIVFGIPLYTGWIYCFMRFRVLSETRKFIREKFEKKNIDHL